MFGRWTPEYTEYGRSTRVGNLSVRLTCLLQTAPRVPLNYTPRCDSILSRLGAMEREGRGYKVGEMPGFSASPFCYSRTISPEERSPSSSSSSSRYVVRYHGFPRYRTISYCNWCRLRCVVIEYIYIYIYIYMYVCMYSSDRSRD